MIASLSEPGTSFIGIIAYNEKGKSKKDDTDNDLEHSKSERLLVKNFSDFKTLYSSKMALADSLESWSATSKRIKKPTFHVALSFDYADKIDNDKLVKIADDFMNRMGYGENPFIVYRHFDKKHEHIHIVSSRVGADGKKIDDFQEVNRAKSICREMEVSYGLTAVSDYKKNGKQYLIPIAEDIGDKTSFKNAVKTNIASLIKSGQVQTIAELIEKAKDLNLGIEIIKNDIGGKVLPKPGIIFYRYNETNRGSHYLTGKIFGKDFLNTIENLIQDKDKIYSIEGYEDKKEYLEDRLSAMVDKIYRQNLSLTELEKIFLQHGYKSEFVSNSGGIYGLRLHDLITGIVSKGSDVHKKLSINELKKIVSESSMFMGNTESAVIATDISQVKEQVLEIYSKLSKQFYISKKQIIDAMARYNIRPEFFIRSDEGRLNGIKFILADGVEIKSSDKNLYSKGNSLSAQKIQAKFVTDSDPDKLRHKLAEATEEILTRNKSSLTAAICELNRVGLYVNVEKDKQLFIISTDFTVPIKCRYSLESNVNNDLVLKDKAVLSSQHGGKLVDSLDFMDMALLTAVKKQNHNYLKQASRYDYTIALHQKEWPLYKDGCHILNGYVEMQEDLVFAQKAYNHRSKQTGAIKANVLVEELNNRGLSLQLASSTTEKKNTWEIRRIGNQTLTMSPFEVKAPLFFSNSLDAVFALADDRERLRNTGGVFKALTNAEIEINRAYDRGSEPGFINQIENQLSSNQSYDEAIMPSEYEINTLFEQNRVGGSANDEQFSLIKKGRRNKK